MLWKNALLFALLIASCAKPEPAAPLVASPVAPPAPPLPALSHTLTASGYPQDMRTLALGDVAPDFSLPGIDGQTHGLKEFADAKVLMVIFVSNHCPTSHAIEKRLEKLRQDLRGQSFALVAINPNHPDGLSIDELGYGRFTDSFADMKPYAQSNGWDFPYLYDGEEQRAARAYGCLATPHAFVFDQERRLRYAGRFDDSQYPDEATVKSPDARNAVEALLAGRPVPAAQTRPHGCSTKWREKLPQARAQEAAWTKLPVAVDHLDDRGAAALRANATRKVRLINVWATWCAPCVAEFPDLVSLSRQFDRRDFELVTISMDDPKDEAKVHDFLQKQGAGVSPQVMPGVLAEGRKTDHYLYAGAGQDALLAALDDQWPGPIPHSILVAPGGKILWRHTGILRRDEACAAIVEALKPYYMP